MVGVYEDLISDVEVSAAGILGGGIQLTSIGPTVSRLR